jgi:hypothetical protein
MRELCNWNYILWNYIFSGTHRFMHNAVGAALNFLSSTSQLLEGRGEYIVSCCTRGI